MIKNKIKENKEEATMNNDMTCPMCGGSMSSRIYDVMVCDSCGYEY